MTDDCPARRQIPIVLPRGHQEHPPSTDLEASDIVQESKSVPRLDSAEQDQSEPGPNSFFIAVSWESLRRNPSFFDVAVNRFISNWASGSAFSPLDSALQLLDSSSRNNNESCKNERDAMPRGFIVDFEMIIEV